tara:strand:+ start:265 stop:786 length:522 start_codon:yes stop_codon:yes gene_type:complete
MNSYRFTQVCINGHIVTDRAANNDKLIQQYCETCGNEVTTSCQHCKTKIRGREEFFRHTVSIGSSHQGVKELSLCYEKPSYCHSCGKAFPWVESAIKQIMDIAKNQEELSEEDCKQLHDVLTELSKNSSTSEIAAFKFNTIIGKVGSTVKNIVTETVVKIITDVATRNLIGGP